MEQKPATIKEIAQRLNVSVSTVSRALHNHPSIGLRTRMQVQKLAEIHRPDEQRQEYQNAEGRFNHVLARLSCSFFHGILLYGSDSAGA